MKHVNIATSDNTATYYVDVYGDIFDTESEAELLGLAGTVTVDGFYVGSADDMRRSALEAFRAAHGNTGKQNALRGDKPLSAQIVLRCPADLKSRAEKVADARGVSLSQLVVSCLESVTER